MLSLSAILFSPEGINKPTYFQNMADFKQDYRSAVELYDELADHINDFSRFRISKKLRNLTTLISCLKSCDPKILMELGRIVEMYQAIENEAEHYVRRARNFAKENHLVAENVLNGKKFYNPLTLLKNFEKTAKRLDDSFRVVISKHSEVARDVITISTQVNDERQRAIKHHEEAEMNAICNIPVLSMVTAPIVRAGQFAGAFSKPAEKALAGLAGVAAGFLNGVVATLTVGIPLYVNMRDEEKYRKVKEEYESIKDFLQKFDDLVSRHKKLLGEIRVDVSMLPDKYIDFKEALESGKVLEDSMVQIDLFQQVCKRIEEACDNYLDSVN